MNEKSSNNQEKRSTLSKHGALKAARFAGITAGVPFGIIQDIRSGIEKVFNPVKSRYKNPQKIAQIEKRLAELEQKIYELSGLKLSGDKLTKSTGQTKVIDMLAVSDDERRILDTVFRYNLKLQKSKSVVK